MSSNRKTDLARRRYLAIAVAGLALLLSSLGCFLSLWIVIPAPTSQLLPLSVGAPEVSPWLGIMNAIAVLIALPRLRRRLYRVTLAMSLFGLLLSTLPLAQLPAAVERMDAAMASGFGIMTSKSMSVATVGSGRLGRSQPFRISEALLGISTPAVRYTPDIQFAAPKGVPLKLHVYRPLLVGQYPAVVVIHGGAWRSGGPSDDADFNRYLAAQGYTVFAIDYRQAPRHQFPAQLEDVQAALSFVVEQAARYEADPNRMALLGRSAGGHLAMLAAYQPNAIPVRAVVSYYGPFNLPKGYADPPRPDPLDVRSVLENFLGGSLEQRPEQYLAASPIRYVNRSLPPTLLIHGDRDHIVQIRFAREMLQRLQAAESPAALLEIPWADHAFDAVFQGPSSQLSLYYTERFLDWALRSPNG